MNFWDNQYLVGKFDIDDTNSLFLESREMLAANRIGFTDIGLDAFNGGAGGPPKNFRRLDYLNRNYPSNRFIHEQANSDVAYLYGPGYINDDDWYVATTGVSDLLFEEAALFVIPTREVQGQINHSTLESPTTEFVEALIPSAIQSNIVPHYIRTIIQDGISAGFDRSIIPTGVSFGLLLVDAENRSVVVEDNDFVSFDVRVYDSNDNVVYHREYPQGTSSASFNSPEIVQGQEYSLEIIGYNNWFTDDASFTIVTSQDASTLRVVKEETKFDQIAANQRYWLSPGSRQIEFDGTV